MINFDYTFFEKHQKTLVFIANSRYLRWILGINRLPDDIKNIKIDRIRPAGIFSARPSLIERNEQYRRFRITKEIEYFGRQKRELRKTDGRNKQRELAAIARQELEAVRYFTDKRMQGNFFTRPRFAEALAFNLSPFSLMMNKKKTMSWRFSPIGLVYFSLLGFVSYKATGIPFGWLGTVTDYYTNTGGDGFLRYNDSSWSTTRGASDASTSGAGTDEGFLCLAQLYSGQYYITRGFMPFDTSGLPSSPTINSAAAKIKFSSVSNDNSTSLVTVQSTQASSTSLSTADFDQCGSLNTPTEGASRLALSSISTGSFNTITLNSTGVGWVSDSSYTKLGFRNSKDVDDSSPTGTNGPACYYAEATGTSNDPYFTVDYSAGTAYTKSLTEAIDPSDTKTTKQTAKNMVEAIDPSDSVRRAGTKRVLETLAVRDIFAMSKVLLKTLIERVLFSDVLSTKQTGKGIKESLSLASSVSIIGTKTKALTEHVTLVVTQVVGKMLSRSLLENVTARDVIANTFSMGRRLVERIGLVERFYGKKNGINMKYLKKYAEKTGTYLKKYFDI